MDRPRTWDVTECNRASRHLIGTYTHHLQAFGYSSSFTFFDDIRKQRLLEAKQIPFEISKLNPYRTFAWMTDLQFVSDATPKEKDVCWDRIELKRIAGL